MTLVSISVGADVLFEESTGFVHLALDLFIPIELLVMVGWPSIDDQFTTGEGESLAFAQRFQLLPISQHRADQSQSPGTGRVVVPSGPTNGLSVKEKIKSEQSRII